MKAIASTMPDPVASATLTCWPSDPKVDVPSTRAPRTARSGAGIALAARLELIQRVAELGGDVDSRDLAVDGEVAPALDAGVLLADRGRDQLTELVEARDVEAEPGRGGVAAVAKQGWRPRRRGPSTMWTPPADRAEPFASTGSRQAMNVGRA